MSADAATTYYQLTNTTKTLQEAFLASIAAAGRATSARRLTFQRARQDATYPRVWHYTEIDACG